MLAMYICLVLVSVVVYVFWASKNRQKRDFEQYLRDPYFESTPVVSHKNVAKSPVRLVQKRIVPDTTILPVPLPTPNTTFVDSDISLPSNDSKSHVYHGHEGTFGGDGASGNWDSHDSTSSHHTDSSNDSSSSSYDSGGCGSDSGGSTGGCD